MYYKKQGNEIPITKAGCVYDESYFFDGYLFLKYAVGNIPSEELAEITQGEYEANKPVIPVPEPPEPTPTDQDVLYAEVIKQLNEINLKLNGGGSSV